MGDVVTPEKSVVAAAHWPGSWSPPKAELRRSDLPLVDLWFLLKSRSKLIFGAVVCALLIAIGVSFLVPSTYESRAVIEIGKVTGGSSQGGAVSSIENPEVVLYRLREEYVERGVRVKGKPYIDSVGHPRNAGPNLIVLKARGPTPEETRGFLGEVVDSLLARHNRIYKHVSSLKEARIAELDREIDALETQAGALAQVAGETEPGQAAVVVLERGNLLSVLSSLRSQRTNLVLSLTGIETYPTRLIRAPALENSPVRPNPLLYVSIGLVAGLVIGIAIALAVESIAKATEVSRIRENRTTVPLS